MDSEFDEKGRLGRKFILPDELGEVNIVLVVILPRGPVPSLMFGLARLYGQSSTTFGFS
jgi:hypothetical protein